MKKTLPELVYETQTAAKTGGSAQTIKCKMEEKHSDSTANAANGGGLVNVPREAWIANLGGSIAFHFIAITFLPDHSFIYRDACTNFCREPEGEEWEGIKGTKGKWRTNGNKITMVFSDGYTVTVPYAVTNDLLIFDFGETGYDKRLGSVYNRYTKEKTCSQ